MDCFNIDLKGSFNDCDFVSYHFSRENNLTFEIQTFYYTKLLFTFYSPILFIDHNRSRIKNFIQTPNDHPILLQCVERYYGEHVKEHPYKLFQFLDLDDEPCHEIICTNVNWIENKCSASQFTWELTQQLNKTSNLKEIANWCADYLSDNYDGLDVELRELVHALSFMEIDPSLNLSKEEVQTVIEENYIEPGDFGCRKPKIVTRRLIRNVYRFIQKFVRELQN